MAMPAEPVGEPPPGPPPLQMTDMGPEAKVQLRQKWMSLRERAADLTMRSVEVLERQRDEARTRGDQAEFDRLDGVIRQQQERLEKMRANRALLSPSEVGGPPEQ